MKTEPIDVAGLVQLIESRAGQQLIVGLADAFGVASPQWLNSVKGS